MPEMLACMDLFLFPSLYEGSPSALLEAMAAGVPLVASDIAPNVLAVPDEAKGYLAGPNDVERLAELASDLLRDEPQRARLGKIFRAHAQKHFSIESALAWLAETVTNDLEAC